MELLQGITGHKAILGLGVLDVALIDLLRFEELRNLNFLNSLGFEQLIKLINAHKSSFGIIVGILYDFSILLAHITSPHIFSHSAVYDLSDTIGCRESSRDAKDSY